MIVVCRLASCDQTVRTAFPEIQPYCGPECARADRVTVVLSPAPQPMPKLAHLVTVPAELLDTTPPALVSVITHEIEQTSIRAITDQLDPADTDTAFVAEQMREAVAATYVGFDKPAPRGWLARALDRLKLTSAQEGPK
jgi:hypothetical protein